MRGNEKDKAKAVVGAARRSRAASGGETKKQDGSIERLPFQLQVKKFPFLLSRAGAEGNGQPA